MQGIRAARAFEPMIKRVVFFAVDHASNKRFIRRVERNNDVERIAPARQPIAPPPPSVVQLVAVFHRRVDGAQKIERSLIEHQSHGVGPMVVSQCIDALLGVTQDVVQHVKQNPGFGEPAILTSRAFAVGWVPEAVYEEQRLRLRSGDRLYMYSDGMNEAMNAARDQFGEERIIETARGCRNLGLQESLDGLAAAAETWSGQAFDDDVTLLAIGRTRDDAT